MKTKLVFAAIVAAFTMVSCGGSGNGKSEESNTKTIKATSTRFEWGDLAKYIEVANEEATLSWSEQEGGIASQTFKLEVELRLKKEIKAIADVDPYDIGLVGLLSGAIIELVDSDGSELIDVDLFNGDCLGFKEFLKGKAGDVKVITFAGEFHNSDDAPKWFKNAVGFKPTGTGSLQIKDGNDYYTPAL